MQSRNVATCKYFARNTPPPPHSTVSEEFHAANQIKANHKCSNMVANNLPAAAPSPDPGVGVKRSKLNFIRTRSCSISNERES